MEDDSLANLGFNFLEKVGGMENWADIGLSTRKFERHGGLGNVRSFALSEAQTAKSLIERNWPEEA